MRGPFQVLSYFILTHVIDYLCLMNNLLTHVKMSISWRQCAWVDGKYYSTHQRLNKEHLNKDNKTWFDKWLVGMTDAEGTFGFYYRNGKWILVYKIALSRYNLRALYHIKKQLGIGTITKDNDKAQILIRDKEKLEKVIFPIFDKYPLLTKTQFYYLRFKQAWRILEDKILTTEQKNEAIKVLLSAQLPDGYVSPAIAHLNETSSYEEISYAISARWLDGFTEAIGNFEINPDGERFSIEYTLVHKSDKFLLRLIKRLLHIPSNVKYNNSKNIYVLNTKNSRVIEKIIKLFTGKFKGMKSLEFKLWSKANYYKNTNLAKVRKIQKITFKLRKQNNSITYR